MDGHKELDDKIYFRYEETQGWYWCGRFLRSDTYSSYADCVNSYLDWTSKQPKTSYQVMQHIEVYHEYTSSL